MPGNTADLGLRVDQWGHLRREVQQYLGRCHRSMARDGQYEMPKGPSTDKTALGRYRPRGSRFGRTGQQRLLPVRLFH